MNDDYMEWVSVTLVGGPFSGNKGVEQAVKGWGPGPSLMLRLHGTFDVPMQSWYGSPTFDVESWRWFRPHRRTEPIEERQAKLDD